METVEKSRIYISYTWRTPGMKERVFDLAEALRAAGVDCRIDLYYTKSLHGFAPPGTRSDDDRPPWRIWQEEQIRDADFVLVVCSREYPESPVGSGANWDVHFMVEEIESGRAERRKFIPIGFGSYKQNSQYAPPFLAGAHYHDLSSSEEFEDLLRRFKSELRMRRYEQSSADRLDIPPVRGESQSSPTERTGVFVSYSHKDKKWLTELQTMLKPLMRTGAIDLWDDTKIEPGAIWKDEIKKALDSSKVALLLVSANFLASDFIAKNELPPLIKAAKEEGVIVFWIYVSACMYQATEIANYQAAHEIKRPLDQLSKPNRQAVLSEVCARIKTLIE
jgi:hypothetical protein